jgi:hypothetical protein
MNTTWCGEVQPTTASVAKWYRISLVKKRSWVRFPVEAKKLLSEQVYSDKGIALSLVV